MEKRPYLKKRTGLLRFYKNGESAESEKEKLDQVVKASTTAKCNPQNRFASGESKAKAMGKDSAAVQELFNCRTSILSSTEGAGDNLNGSNQSLSLSEWDSDLVEKREDAEPVTFQEYKLGADGELQLFELLEEMIESPISSSQKIPSLLNQNALLHPSQKSPTFPKQKSIFVHSQKNPIFHNQKSLDYSSQMIPSAHPKETSPMLPNEKSSVIPSHKFPIISSQKSPVLPNQKSPVLPSQKSPVFPNQRSPILVGSEVDERFSLDSSFHSSGSSNSLGSSRVSIPRTLGLEIELEKAKSRINLLEQMSVDKERYLKESKQSFEEMKERELRFIEEEKTRLERKKQRMTKITADLEEIVRLQPMHEDEVRSQKETIKSLEDALNEANSRLKASQDESKKIIAALETQNSILTKKLEVAVQSIEDKKTLAVAPSNEVNKNTILKTTTKPITPKTTAPPKTNASKPLVLKPAISKPVIVDSLKSSRCRKTVDSVDSPYFVADNVSGSSKRVDNTKILKNPSPYITDESKRIFRKRGRNKESQNGEVSINLKENGKPKAKGVHFSPEPKYFDDISTESCFGRKAPKSTITNNNERTLVEAEEESIVGSNGEQETRLLNGTVKTVAADGMWKRLAYFNGDIKETYADGRIRYYYSGSNAWQTTYSNGLVMIKFDNGVVEKKFPAGHKEFVYPNGCTRTVDNNGREECVFTDGTKCTIEPNGDRTLCLPNGQKEIHTQTYRKRIYPDGTIRTLHEDGTVTTNYPDGRYRVKDKDGNVCFDGFSSRKN